MKNRPKALDPRKKVPVRLEEKIELSHDTRLFRFALPTKEHILGLPVSSTTYMHASIGLFAQSYASTKEETSENLSYLCAVLVMSAYVLVVSDARSLPLHPFPSPVGGRTLFREREDQ